MLKSNAAALGLFVALACAASGPSRAAEVDSSTGAAAVMLGARIVGDDLRVRFVADLSRKVDSTVFTLADPYRIVVDMPQVDFALPELAGSSGRGLIKAFRYGMIQPGRSRIVIDLTGPATIDKTFTVDPSDGQPARLVIDAVPATRDEFIAATRAYKKTQTEAAGEKSDRATGFDADDKPIIVLDPGHGGIDLGTRSSDGTLEKNVTLAFAKVLGDQLSATGRYKVVFTRQDDSFIALGDRMNVAHERKAKLFISIHANSFPGSSVRGATVYTASDEASDKMAEALADSENQSDALAGIDVNAADSNEVMGILNDLTRRETRNFGVSFARNLVTELGRTTKMFKDPHKEADFKVLEAPDVPSALVELGYLTNAADAKLMVSRDWQDKTAGSIVTAIDEYCRTHQVANAAN